jgi:murein DD-endopeptidase MepM/ murein hydrolase activator NlpD
LKLHNSVDGGLMVYAADASNRFVLMYGHLDHYADGLRDGQPLRQGDVIGYVGSTGDAAEDAPHLHFAIAHPTDVKLWWTGRAIDPRPLLQQAVSGGSD